jgi:hypothetical protein
MLAPMGCICVVTASMIMERGNARSVQHVTILLVSLVEMCRAVHKQGRVGAADWHSGGKPRRIPRSNTSLRHVIE